MCVCLFFVLSSVTMNFCNWHSKTILDCMAKEGTKVSVFAMNYLQKRLFVLSIILFQSTQKEKNKTNGNFSHLRFILGYNLFVCWLIFIRYYSLHTAMCFSFFCYLIYKPLFYFHVYLLFTVCREKCVTWDEREACCKRASNTFISIRLTYNTNCYYNISFKTQRLVKHQTLYW